METSRSVSFWWNEAVEVIEATEVVEVIEAAEVTDAREFTQYAKCKLAFSVKRHKQAKNFEKTLKISLHLVRSNSFLHNFFLNLFFWRLWWTGMLLLSKLKGHRSNFHYSGFPNHPHTKSSLNISICQIKLKRKCLPRDTLYLVYYHCIVLQIFVLHWHVCKK
jgi:hypothetical protein